MNIRAYGSSLEMSDEPVFSQQKSPNNKQRLKINIIVPHSLSKDRLFFISIVYRVPISFSIY